MDYKSDACTHERDLVVTIDSFLTLSPQYSSVVKKKQGTKTECYEEGIVN